MKELGKTGIVGRFKPLHNGGAIMLDNVCEKAEHVVIGIGSCNKYNLRNPFTAEESRDMIDAYLNPKFKNYEFIFIPDYGHLLEYQDGQMWRKHITENYGALDSFVSGNEYVAKLLENDYITIHPGDITPRERWMMLNA